MDDDEEEDGPAIGKKPKHIKLPNPINEPKRQRKREQAEGVQPQGQQDQQVQPQSKIPPFGDDSYISRDWTTSGLFDDPIIQYEDTCGSVVFTRLLQASYNKDKVIAERRELSYRDLAEYIKGKTKKGKFSFRNMNIPIRYIRNVGLHRDGKISRHGVKTKGYFDQQQNATSEFIYDKLETTALGIVIAADSVLEKVGMGIYHVPAMESEIHDDEHAMLVVAKGVTNGGLNFLVAQNSWGKQFGNSGYCRNISTRHRIELADLEIVVTIFFSV